MRNGMIIETKVFRELQVGSYEELLTSLDEAVSADCNRDIFGSEVVLFATYPKHVVVVSEDGQFSNVDYTNKDGIIKLGKAKKIDVSVLSEEDVITRGIDNFSDGKSLKESLRSLVGGCAKCDSPLDRVRQAAGVLFSGGKFFRSYFEEHKDVIGNFAWDADYGKLDLGIDPKFFFIYSEAISESDIDLHREDVLQELSGLERRLQHKVVEISEAIEEFQGRTVEPRGEEIDAMFAKFESFSADYLNYLTEVANFVSDTIRNNDCVACSAFAHDEVAKRFKEIELCGRFVRKVASEFAR